MSKSFRDYPVGVAQQKVLDALGITASGFQDAQNKFDELGITVGSKRQGRTSVPVVSVQQGGSQRNLGGDFDVWDATANQEALDKLIVAGIEVEK
jgi:hypothetical protein